MPGSLVKTDMVRQLEVEAEKGAAESQYKLGLRYTIDSDWVVDHIRGYRWFLAAADQGHANAQYMTGLAKLNARGTFTDERGAVEYFRLAALQGHARAQFQLGNAYLNGVSVDQDKPWGRQWLEQAAWNGHRDAQFLLGALFSAGVGGQKNIVEAWRWLKLAAFNKHILANPALKKLTGRMSAEELSLAESLVAQGPPKSSKLNSLPKVRYVQTMLNQLGFSAGDEDGVVGSKTLAATAVYAHEKKLPQETRVLQLIESLRGSF